ncbi:MAG: hypothetical protein GF330_08820 [Candidatus Eisenbacteria bacterium]|nr:hypothetical protein [Candidatus Eisenbacteria bacterium]
MQPRGRRRGRVRFAPVLLLLVATASATTYWSPDDPRVCGFDPSAGERPAPTLHAAPAETRLDPSDCRQAFERAAAYLACWQVRTPEDPQYGGVRESEHIPDVVQTDNTSQAIWVWSRWATLSGDAQYRTHAEDAFAYSARYPAYLEEGGSSPELGYYRMYNCAWAIAAEAAYRDAFDDEYHRSYADSCANYIAQHALVRPGSGFYAYVNPPVYAWALGQLYAAGERDERPDWRAAAVTKADTVLGWVCAEPALLADETWAVSGGVTLWGLLGSYFRAHSGELQAWLALYGDSLATAAGSGGYQNGWDGWYALGHWAIAEALDDPEHRDVHAGLTAGLLAQDGDLDGGIPGSPADDDDMDQSWVSSLLALAGCNPLLRPVARIDELDPSGGAARIDAPGLAIAGPSPARDGVALAIELPAATTIDLAAFDMQGRRVASLFRGLGAPGRRALFWDGCTEGGRLLPAGVYWLRLTAPEHTVVRSIVRLE